MTETLPARTYLWATARAAACSAALLLPACVDGSLDGKASTVTTDPSAVGEAGAPGDFVREEAELALTCPEHIAKEELSSELSIVVTDGDGRSPSADSVFVQITPSSGTIRAASAGGALVDASGAVAFRFSAPDVDEDRTVTIAASIPDDDNRSVASASCSLVVVAEPLRFTAPEHAERIVHGSDLPASLQLRGVSKVGKCSSGGGLRVSYSGPGGGGLRRREDDPIESELCLELASGSVPQFFVHAGASGGMAQLTASFGTFREVREVRLVGAPVSVRIDADLTDVGLQSASNLSLEVLDDAGQPVSGATVTLSLERCASASCAGGESITPLEVTTDANGTASAAYFSGTERGAAQIVARLLGDDNVGASFVVRVAPPEL